MDTGPLLGPDGRGRRPRPAPAPRPARRGYVLRGWLLPFLVVLGLAIATLVCVILMKPEVLGLHDLLHAHDQRVTETHDHQTERLEHIHEKTHETHEHLKAANATLFETLNITETTLEKVCALADGGCDVQINSTVLAEALAGTNVTCSNCDASVVCPDNDCNATALAEACSASCDVSALQNDTQTIIELLQNGTCTAQNGSLSCDVDLSLLETTTQTILELLQNGTCGTNGTVDCGDVDLGPLQVDLDLILSVLANHTLHLQSLQSDTETIIELLQNGTCVAQNGSVSCSNVDLSLLETNTQTIIELLLNGTCSASNGTVDCGNVDLGPLQVDLELVLSILANHTSDLQTLQTDTQTILEQITTINSTCAASICPPAECDCQCNVTAECSGMETGNDPACDDFNPCTADVLVNGVCSNPRLPIGTLCEHCMCFRNGSNPTCDRYGRCRSPDPQDCMGNCAVDGDCPNLAWVKTDRVQYADAAEQGNDYHTQYCHANQSVCIYYVRADLDVPWENFTATDCVESQFARDSCWNLLDRQSELTPCLVLESKCASTQGINSKLDLHCTFYFGCASPVIYAQVP